MSTGRAPIAVFVYRRLEHTRRTLEALMMNNHASDCEVVVFSDGPKDELARDDVGEVRRYVRTLCGFRSVRIVEREENFGLAKSIITGVTEILRSNDRIIVVEDDLVTSPHFLDYMNDSLECYRDDDRVACIHGYVYPVMRTLPETFFLRGADCWGWGTWARAWRIFVADGSALLAQLRGEGLTREFDFNGSFDYTQMLQDQIAGVNNSWAIRWYASAFLARKLCLYPGRSLVRNIGNDSSGAHAATTDTYDVELAPHSIHVGGIAVEDSRVGREAFIEFGRKTRPLKSAAPVVRALLRRALRLK
jgi:hypothetical protein